MASIKELFVDLNKRHGEAAAINDLNAIGQMVNEYETLLNLAPNELPILFGLGTAKLQLGANGSAMSLFQHAISLNDKVPEIWNNLGSAFKAESNDVQARVCFEKALALREEADYYNNLATLYVNQGDPEPGLELCRKGIALNPDQPRLHWNYSLMLLEMGRWKEGLEHYDYGLLAHDRMLRHYDHPERTQRLRWFPWWKRTIPALKVPEWQGEPGKVVVYGEQGMGDEIMFASCIPDMAKDCEVIFECHDRLEGLFRRSFPQVKKWYPTRKSNAIEWPFKERPDYKIAIGSLFRRYRADGVFPKLAYLKPDPVRVAKYRQRLEATGPGPYVGISWLAGHKKTNTKERSFKLAQFKPILEQGGTFISLQYNGEEGKCERFFEETGFRIHHWPEVVEAGPNETRYPGYDYDETVALVAALDLCIVPNTTIVHLCGAMGKECWTITPKEVAWRYQMLGDQMPMYGEWVTQFRENECDAFQAVADAYGDYRRTRPLGFTPATRALHRLIRQSHKAETLLGDTEAA